MLGRQGTSTEQAVVTAHPSAPSQVPRMTPPQFDRDDVRRLLTLLNAPADARHWDLGAWDLAIRRARQSELLGVVAYRLRDVDGDAWVPAPVRRHLDAAVNLYLHRRMVGLHVLWGLGPLFEGAAFPIVVLKGAAYVLQGLPMSRGRLFDDVDIMVPRGDLPSAEARLEAGGWKSTMPDPYDQRYYREWSHEIPPLEHARFAAQLDVHHTILPVTGRVTPVPAALFERSRPLDGTPWRVLHPADQVIHAAAHLLQDSDCAGRFREVVDIDGLVRCHSDGPGFWDDLLTQAERHSLSRTVWLALRYARRWLSTPVPDAVTERLERHKPPDIVVAVLDRWISRVVFGPHPDARPPFLGEVAAFGLKTRAMWLRMPVPLLAYHTASKAIRALRRS